MQWEREGVERRSFCWGEGGKKERGGNRGKGNEGDILFAQADIYEECN